ncbi:molecular chaperone DnaK [Candidatus Sumerlaeota bacterium]|nr:molecular chaperone DnaK [Candidatus Sumerlaeota bacterium]
MIEESKIIGIDLGTTNSVVAVVEGNEPIVIPNQEGSNKTPSVVAFLDNNDCIVGEIARRQATTNSPRTITSIKRIMGLDYEDVEEWVDVLPFKLVEHDDRLLIDVNGMGYTPEQISALVIRKLKESAEAFLGQEVKQAVITVPANFDDNQRNATSEAARLAGLEVLRLINEPTAAALAYGLGKTGSPDETIAVFDFGGGTFDITILEISDKTFEVLTSTGDTHLGGDDLDNALVKLIIQEFQEAHGVDLSKDVVTIRRLKEVAEKAKCELSSTKSTMITLPFIAYRDKTPLHLERRISRDELEEIAEPFINRTIRCCKRAIEDAGLSKKDIKKVILVGGSTRMPLVQDAVEDFFGMPPFKGINPDEVVALGAATQGGVFSGNIQEVTLLDVAPHSLGIEVKDGKFSPIIDKNATIPIKAAKNFTTTEDDQTFVNIHILQGENEDAAENRSLGKFILTDIPPQPRGRPRVRVTFFVNADGVMEISAEELTSGLAKSLTIVHSELDASERKSRKRARQRKTGRSGSSSAKGTSGEKRYEAGATGAPTALPGDSPGKRTRGADSSITPMEPPRKDDVAAAQKQRENRDKGSIAAPAGRRISSDEVKQPIRSAETQDEASAFVPPTRYGRTASPSPTKLHSPSSETQKERQENDIPTPPPAAPPDDEHTFRMDPQVDQGRSIHADQTIPAGSRDVLSNLDIKTDLPVAVDMEEMEWPGLIDSALDLASGSDLSPDAQDLYDKALEALNREPWSVDPRYGVVHARAIFQMMLGRAEEFRTSMNRLQEKFASVRHEAITDLFQKAIDRFPTLASLRRDRGRMRELRGQLDGASEDFEYAGKLDPQDTDNLSLERIYKARMAKGKDPAAQFKLVKIYLKSNRVDEAIEILQELQHNDAYETRAVKILGLCHWQKNLHFLAWQKFKQLHPNEEIRDILYRLATDMEATGQLNNALTVYEHIASESPDYRDVNAKVKKIRYRMKVQQEEADQNKASILADPRFTIIEEINRGSMGIIFKAKDKTLDEDVALKVLNDYLTADPAAVERFKREARAAKKLSHPYIVRIHDLFETGSKRFISMEYIEGNDLKRMLSERTTFSEDQLIYYFLQICDALAYAHKLNIIHRDIKPANIMITKQNNVKVTDFGIAKMLKSDDSTKSGTAIIGTPLYMAPEQITGEGVDPRSDIYSLGIMMYELVSGHPPFYLGNIEYHHIHTPPPPLPDKVSPMLRRVIMRCVEKSPANRYQSVDEIFEDLKNNR